MRYLDVSFSRVDLVNERIYYGFSKKQAVRFVRMMWGKIKSDESYRLVHAQSVAYHRDLLSGCVSDEPDF